MKIKQLTIENYKSFQQKTIINFPTVTKERNIFLIGGMNGAGKTSLTEAIHYCLYGAKERDIFKAINNKEKAKNNAFVNFELVLETDDLEEIKIRRSWSAGTVDSPKAKDLIEKLIVVKEGKRVSVQNKQQWDTFINGLIPKSITQFFFFDGEKIQEIAEDNNMEIRLKNSLEAALGLQYISQLSQDVLKLKTDERKEFVEITDEDILFKESELKKEESVMKRTEAELKDVENQLSFFRDEYQKLKEKFNAIFQTDPEEIESAKILNQKKMQLANEKGQLDLRIKQLLEKELPFALASSLFSGLKSKIEEDKQSLGNEAIIDNLDIIAEKVIEAYKYPAPIHLDMTKEQETEYESRIKQHITKQFSSIKDTYLDFSERELAGILNKIDEIYSSDINILDDLIIERTSIEHQISEIEKGQITYSDSEQSTFDTINSDLEGFQTQIAKYDIKRNDLIEKKISIENKISSIKKELDALYSKHKISKSKHSFLDECDRIANVLTEFNFSLRKSKVQKLKDNTFEMYKLLSSKSRLIKEININKDSYEIDILDQRGQKISKTLLSAGEKEIFAISLLWGLARTSQINLPIIIDTPLSRLDSVHRSNIVDNYFPNAAEQVIILSTDTEIDSNYFEVLENHLAGSGRLQYNQINELSQYQDGYFWNK